MDPIERGLQQEIPLKEASAFFLELKYGKNPEEKLASRDIAVVRGRLKQAMMGAGTGGMGAAPPPPATMMTATPPPLPSTGQGMNAIKTAADDNDKAHAQLASKFDKHEHSKGERAFSDLGGAAGALVGGAAGHKLGKHPTTAAAGALIGYALGKSHGKSIGTSLDAHSFKKKAAAIKRAYEDMFGDNTSPGTLQGPVDMREYIASEEMGQAAEEENHAEFLRQRLQQAMTELQSAKDMAMTSQQTAEQLQQAEAQHQQQLTAAQQQSQLATEAAMQNVQQAHELALKATTQALQAKDDAINTHQMAAQMRMAYQDMRGSIMDAVAQDAAAPIGEAIKQKGMEAQSVVPGDPSQDPSAGESGPDQGQEGAPKEGGSGDTPSPANVAKDAQPQEQAGGEGSPPAAAAPNSLAPSSSATDDHANQANAEAGSGNNVFDGKDPKPTLQVGVQAQPGVGGSAKQAGVKLGGPWGQVFSSAMGHLKENAPYAAAGGALGAALPFAESRVGHDDLRAKVKGLEGEQGGGFGHTLQLAQSKIRLALGEISEKHPVGASIAGGVMGAAAGAALGPQVMEGFRALPGRLKELRGQPSE